MLENENLCGGCENNCCIDFRLYWSMEEVAKLLKEYSYFRVVDTGVAFVGKHEKEYRKMACDRLQTDDICTGYPGNRPAFCENTGIENRPAVNCKLNDIVKTK